MSDNVIILGAGFSASAGIPLLGNFIDTMIDYNLKGVKNAQKIDNLKMRSINKALDIRNEMDSYPSRVSYDDRNIEDILSILSFNVLGGGNSEKEKLKSFSEAISNTIEVSCSVKHPGFESHRSSPFGYHENRNNDYMNFWKSLFIWASTRKEIPTIISFNYDLVLERSLLHVLNGEVKNTNSIYENEFIFNYGLDLFPKFHIKVKRSSNGYKEYTYAERTNILNNDHLARKKVNLFKLHGSVNFPKKLDESNSAPSFTEPVENPFILPPVANKQMTRQGEQMWKSALLHLRSAKNVIFVGYSLPKTDIYMQYFLKAALGPNNDLSKVFVYDPILWKDVEANDAMRERYSSCFSENMRKRISFNPPTGFSNRYAGTATDFIHNLAIKPDNILFG